MNRREQQKYRKAYATLPNYGKNWQTGGRFHKNVVQRYFPRGCSVLDIGCGNGTSTAWLRERGYKVAGVDIADNAANMPGFHVADIASADSMQPLERRYLNFDYGFCVDLMEHLPEESVADALANIREICRHGCYFHIAQDQDRDGEAIGETLHLTIRDRAWWHARLAYHWPRIVELYNNPGAHYTVLALASNVDGELNAK